MTKPPRVQTSRLLAALGSNAYFLLIVGVAFWGGNTVAGKAAVGNIDPYTLMILRWAGATLAILPFVGGALRKDLPTLRRHWLIYLFYGAVGFATFNVCLYLAAYYTSGINIALDQVAINVMVMLFSFLLFRTRVKPLQLVGVALTILGVALIATHGDLRRLLALDVNLGDAFVLLACFVYAVYSIALRWRPATHWVSFMLATFVAALIASIAYQIVLGGGLLSFWTGLGGVTPTGWGIAVYTVLFPSLVSQIVYVRGVELIGANRASLFINLIPLFGSVGSVLILGERFESFHLVAAGLFIAGVILAEWSARRG